MRFKKYEVKINGKKTFYWQKNEDKDETIVFLHGFPGNHMGLIDLANGFTKGYRLIIPDLPGSGKSNKLDKDNTLDDYANWMNDFLEKLSLNNITLVGHSFGSRVALFFCAKYSKYIKRLVLLTPILKNDGLLNKLASLRYKLTDFLPANFKKAYLNSKTYQKVVSIIVSKSKNIRKRSQILDRNIKELQHIDPSVQIEMFDEFYKKDLTELGKKINAKCLVIAGDKDIVATTRSIKQLVGLIKNVNFKVMKDAGHLLPLEKPLATSSIIESWLKGK